MHKTLTKPCKKATKTPQKGLTGGGAIDEVLGTSPEKQKQHRR